MIAGVVWSDECRIRLKVKGLRGWQQEVEAVIDTGYAASLTLPPAVVTALGLRWRSANRFTLADGSECFFDVYVAKVDWDGKVRAILVDEVDAGPLVGMRLLRGHELKVQVRYRGKVTIKRLPAGTAMELDTSKIDDAVLALLYLGLHDGARAWKGFDWNAMNRLHEQGYITDPRGKAKSVVFTEEGLERAKRLVAQLFCK
jgi:clan AA aspartic protease